MAQPDAQMFTASARTAERCVGGFKAHLTSEHIQQWVAMTKTDPFTAVNGPTLFTKMDTQFTNFVERKISLVDDWPN